MLDTNYTEIILNPKDVCIEKVASNSTTITIFLEQKRKPHDCPICGTITNTIHDYRQQTIKDIPMSGKAVFYILRKRRYVCKSCGKRFWENISFLNRYQRMTTRI